MITQWTKHCKTDSEKSQFENSVRSSRWLLDHLDSLLKEMDDLHEKGEMSPKAYDLPNWDYRQADSNGYRRCLKQISKLINLDLKEENDRQPVRYEGRPPTN